MPLSTFAQNLRIARNLFGWSQREAALQIGISLNAYGSYEESRAEPCHAILLKIAKTYSIHDLQGFIGDAQYYSRQGTREVNLMLKHYETLRPEAQQAMLALLRAL